MTIYSYLSARMNFFGFFLLLPALALTACSDPGSSVTVKVRDGISDTIVIQNVAVFDSVSMNVLPSMDVSIQNGKILALRASGQIPLSGQETLISGDGATLVPGLIDMHGHVASPTGPTWELQPPEPENNLLAYVYSGVTTVFDVGDSSDDAYSRRDQVAAGELIGPRIFTAGRIITSPDGHPRAMVEELMPWWIKWLIKPGVATGIETQQEAVEAIDERADAGADAIKIVMDSIPLGGQQLDTALARSVVEHARSRGLRTVAHVGTTADAIAAADAGVALWVHGVYKERIPDDKIAALLAYNIPMVSTSEVFDRYGRSSIGPIVATKLELETVPKRVLQSFYPLPADLELGKLTSWLELMATTIEVRLDNVARLNAAGATLLAGSDVQSGVFPGASLHRELATLVRAGLTPAEAIRAATFYPARFLANGEEPDAGVIAVGKRADMVLVEGDPTLDIKNLANIREVILKGKLLDRMPVQNSVD